MAVCFFCTARCVQLWRARGCRGADACCVRPCLTAREQEHAQLHQRVRARGGGHLRHGRAHRAPHPAAEEPARCAGTREGHTTLAALTCASPPETFDADIGSGCEDKELALTHALWAAGDLVQSLRGYAPLAGLTVSVPSRAATQQQEHRLRRQARHTVHQRRGAAVSWQRRRARGGACEGAAQPAAALCRLAFPADASYARSCWSR